jgi:hypothetical protein
MIASGPDRLSASRHGRSAFHVCFGSREPVGFRPIPLKDLTNSPSYRADIATLASMFRYALASPRRASLLAFLRFGVISWARPDAIMDASAEPRRGQWHSAACAFALNPAGRRQTRKYRATVPIPECVSWWLDEARGPLVPRGLSKATWRQMESALGLPVEGQSGMRLIRRSIATLSRKQLGEEHWVQGRIMLGRVQPTTSDIYAVSDPAHLGRALAVTTALITGIETLSPGAFYRSFTAQRSEAAAPDATQAEKMVGVARIELATPAMSTQCSTTELHAHTGNRRGVPAPSLEGAFKRRAGNPQGGKRRPWRPPAIRAGRAGPRSGTCGRLRRRGPSNGTASTAVSPPARCARPAAPPRRSR